MLRDEIKELKGTERELRRFGLTVGGVLAGLGLLYLVRGKGYPGYFLAAGTLLMTPALIFPKCLRPVYLAWMLVALVLGFSVSRAILTVFFFLVITPIGLIARLSGKDFLHLRPNRQASTYWVSRERSDNSKTQFEKQF